MQRENDIGRCLRRLSFQDLFYRQLRNGKFIGKIKGFPLTLGGWCKKLKYEKIDFSKDILHQIEENGKNMGFPFLASSWVVPQFEAFSFRPRNEGQKINIVRYLGIAADEPKRIAKHIGKDDVVLPLVEIGWEEDLCGLISKYQGLLSPTYESATRDGCWFCPNQGVGQLRNLRRKHPDLWALLLKWDKDSPVTYHPDGHTVHDFDERFRLEDEGLIDPNEPFRWSMLKGNLQFRFF